MLRGFVAFSLILLSAAAAAAPIEVKINQRTEQYRLTGSMTLRDPQTDELLGTYRFATGGAGRGAAPFGHWVVGTFRGHDDDPLNIGERFMVHHLWWDDGEAWDDRIKATRTEIELHRLRYGPVTLGCFGFFVTPDEWKQFVAQMKLIIESGKDTSFDVAGNPEGRDEPPVVVASYIPRRHFNVGKRRNNARAEHHARARVNRGRGHRHHGRHR